MLALLIATQAGATENVPLTLFQGHSSLDRKLVASVKSLSLDCDPCIDRTLTRLVAILPTEASTAISSAMQQTADDMNVDLRIRKASEGQDMARLLQAEYEADPTVDAWILNLADQAMEEAARKLQEGNENMVIFGWGWGYLSEVAKSAVGWMASEDERGGLLAAQQFYTEAASRNESITHVSFVMDGKEVKGKTLLRQAAFQQQLDLLSSSEGQVSVDTILVATKDTASSRLTPLFQNCPKQAILFDSTESIELAVDLKAEYGCSTMLGLFLNDFDADLNPEVYGAITREEIAFALNPKLNLQSSMPVLLASIFASTGKVPSMPLEVPTYWTGPKLITKRNVLSDTTAACELGAFPVCSRENEYLDSHANEEEEGHVCPCTERKAIRIGGVLHGSKGGFWDPVYAAAEQAALDMNIELDLEAFEPDTEFSLIVDRMAARIRNLCDSGVDGLFVTIPSPKVADAVQRCLDLSIPVISVNSGEKESRELGLAHHIGQNEYAGGYGAAQRLIEAGMKRGYCLDHQFGHLALAERCQGFEDAINAADGVEFIEHLPVPSDNDAQFLVTLKEAVGETGDWEGIGFLQLDANMFPILEKALEGHSGALSGEFDLASHIYDALGGNSLQFAIDQQPFLQGNLPVYLLTYIASTQQQLTNQLVQSGPSFVEEVPTEQQKVCEANFFAVCPERPEEDMSYISSSLLALGYSLFGILALLCLLAFAWTYLYRETRVVKVSQPMFLYLTVIGAVISSCSILFMGAQTSYRLDKDSSGDFIDRENPGIGFVDASCMAVPWLYGMGFVITFSALLAKIYRVKLMFQAGVNLRRKPVTLQNAVPVMVIMLFVELVILVSWQLVAPLRWTRDVTDEVDGLATESVGSCNSGSQGWAFYLVLVAFHVLCLFYALVLCFQTRHLNSDFAESSYVSLAVAFMFQVLLLVAPISALVHDNTDVFYFIRVASLFLQNFTVLILIFVPKVVRMHEEDPSFASKSIMSTFSRKPGQQTEQAPAIDRDAQFIDEENSDRAAHPDWNMGQNSASKKPSTRETLDSWAIMSVSDAESGETPDPLETAVSTSSLNRGRQKKKAIPKREVADSWAAMNLSDVDRSESSASSRLNETGLDIIAEASESECSEEPLEHKKSTATSNSPFLPPDAVLSDWETLGFPSPEFAQRVVDLLSQSTNSQTRQTISSGIAGTVAVAAAESDSCNCDALLSSEEVLSKWEDLGFTSKEFAERVVGLLSSSMDPATRRMLAASFERNGTSDSGKDNCQVVVDMEERHTQTADEQSRTGKKPDEELRAYLKREIPHVCEPNYFM